VCCAGVRQVNSASSQYLGAARVPAFRGPPLDRSSAHRFRCTSAGLTRRDAMDLIRCVIQWRCLSATDCREASISIAELITFTRSLRCDRLLRLLDRNECAAARFRAGSEAPVHAGRTAGARDAELPDGFEVRKLTDLPNRIDRLSTGVAAGADDRLEVPPRSFADWRPGLRWLGVTMEGPAMTGSAAAHIDIICKFLVVVTEAQCNNFAVDNSYCED
jgi:hypothetical protein